MPPLHTPAAAPQPEPQPPAEQAPTKTKAMVAKLDTRCPECGGEEYFRPHGQPNAMAKCYTCGHNPRFQQSTAGLPSGPADGPSTPSRQIANGGAGGRSNYRPDVFIRPDGTVPVSR